LQEGRAIGIQLQKGDRIKSITSAYFPVGLDAAATGSAALTEATSIYDKYLAWSGSHHASLLLADCNETADARDRPATSPLRCHGRALGALIGSHQDLYRSLWRTGGATFRHAASGGEHRIDFIWAKNAYAVA